MKGKTEVLLRRNLFRRYTNDERHHFSLTQAERNQAASKRWMHPASNRTARVAKNKRNKKNVKESEAGPTPGIIKKSTSLTGYTKGEEYTREGEQYHTILAIYEENGKRKYYVYQS